MLDLGAVVGIAGYLFSDCGIRIYHGFEYEASVVALAQQLLANTGIREHFFYEADLSDRSHFYTAHRDKLLDEYDVVLF